MDAITSVTPLGLRFWDDVSHDLVRDGLTVAAWPEGQSVRVTHAFPNRSGVWVLRSLPGMQAFEHGRGDDEYWDDVSTGSVPELGPRPTFVVEVRDQQGRFLPVRLSVRLPVRGIFQWPPSGVSSNARALADASPGVLPLFSAPRRTVSGRAVMRAELEDAATDQPASHALVELLSSGVVVGRGLSDISGRVVVAFPYPELDHSFLTIPPPHPVTSWTWDLSLRVRWARPSSGSTATPPFLSDVFEQPLVTPISSRATEDPLHQVTFKHANDLVLRSTDSPRGRLSLIT